jgi:hypothetical protein
MNRCSVAAHVVFITQLFSASFDLAKRAWHHGMLLQLPPHNTCASYNFSCEYASYGCSCRSDIHAPDSTRVNAALSQMQEFSNTFLSDPPHSLLHLRAPHLALQLPRRVAYEHAREQMQGVVMPCTLARALVAIDRECCIRSLRAKTSHFLTKM